MVIDCIEFNKRFRLIDPVADMVLAVMDFAFHGRRDLARVFADAYFTAAGDAEGRELLPLDAEHRAGVRGMVEGILMRQNDVSAADRQAARERADSHWLHALAELETRGRRPGLLLVSGLPGIGNSTLSRRLAARAGFEVIRAASPRGATFREERQRPAFLDTATRRGLPAALIVCEARSRTVRGRLKGHRGTPPTRTGPFP